MVIPEEEIHQNNGLEGESWDSPFLKGKIMLIKNIKIFTMNDNNDIIDNGYIVTEKEKIVDLGKMDELTELTNDSIDMNGASVYPGFIDAHTHLGVFGETSEESDGNEDSDPITPQLNVIDAINTNNPYFKKAIRAGVTTVLVSPGSTNPVGGQIAAIKTASSSGVKRPRIDDLIIKSPAAIKFSLGENPKTTYSDKEQMPVTRMAVAALIREILEKAKRYEKQLSQYQKEPDKYDEPEYDQKLESLLPLIKRQIPAHFHAHTADDIHTALRLAREYNLRIIIVHGTEGYEICDSIKNEAEGVLSGPILTDVSKPELRNMSDSSAAIMSEYGIPTAIITDHPETPVNYLLICAAAAVRAGMKRTDALRAVTVTPAKICGISDRVGSIEKGKDADLVFYKGDALDIIETPQYTMISGKLMKNGN